MNEDFNIQCDNLKNNIINILNNSKLPVAIVYYIFKDIYHDVENSYIGYLNTVKINASKEAQKKIQDIQNQINNFNPSDQDDD